ncbi:hypothetical protein OESDEN_03038 [Oesophagostomum dentatum]|uniref:ZP domain-containing protein n=1 Tax=Oesophagostomum dentatum TaxID=61180 RepID=A0A0B1TNK5_OESDE|nr:hypothetical protein OESDEN_03038 [Oesophagostomum dentatum]
MRLFSGSMKTKRKKDVLCERKIPPSFAFIVQMPYKECGLDEVNSPYPSHSGLVHVKEGSTNLVTVRDKILQVSCRIHSQVDFTEQMLTAQLRVDELNTTHRALTNNIIYASTESPRPRYSLVVLNANGIETDVVESGEQGWLSLRINNNSENHIFVSNLVARDVNTNEVLNLIDDDGCVTDRGQVLGILRPSPGEIRYKVNFDGFNEQAQFVYQALVETCSFDCSPKCNQELWLGKENQNDLSGNSVRAKRDVRPRQIELTQDIYKIHGGRITMVSPRNSQKQMDAMKLRQDIDITREMKTIREGGVHMQMVIILPGNCIDLVQTYCCRWKKGDFSQHFVTVSQTTSLVSLP